VLDHRWGPASHAERFSRRLYVPNDSRAWPRSNKMHIASLTATAAAALMTYLLMNHLLLGDLIEQFPERAFYKTLVYFLWISCAFAVFAFLVLTASTLVLGLFFLVFFICLATNYAYALISKSIFTPEIVEWIVHETGNF